MAQGGRLLGEGEREMSKNTIPDPEDSPFVNVPQAAKLLGVGRESAYRAVKSGEIPSIRIGKKIRIPVAALRRLAGLEK